MFHVGVQKFDVIDKIFGWGTKQGLSSSTTADVLDRTDHKPRGPVGGSTDWMERFGISTGGSGRCASGPVPVTPTSELLSSSCCRCSPTRPMLIDKTTSA